MDRARPDSLVLALSAQEALYLVAVAVAVVWGIRACRLEGWNPAVVFPGVMLSAAAALLGAWLHGRLIGRGLSFFGGLALGSLAVLAYLRWQRLPVARACDLLAPVAPLLYAVFRLGCFLVGDDYGRPTSLPWGIRFPEGSPPTSVPVHPTQLYEILLMLPVFLWLLARRRAGLPPGAVTFELCILMGAERFLVEFWRGAAPVALGLTSAQWLALALATVGLGGWTALTARAASGRAAGRARSPRGR